MPDNDNGVKNKIQEVQIEVEQKIINLMLTHLDVVSELVDKGISYKFFSDVHQHLIQSIYAEFTKSNGKRLLTHDQFRDCLINEGQPQFVSNALAVFYKCRFGHVVDKDNLGLLLEKLIDYYVSKQNLLAFDKFNKNIPVLGHLNSTRQLYEDMVDYLSLAETKKSVFVTLDDFRTNYLDYLKSMKENNEIILRCSIPEIDSAMNLGFKNGHISLFVGAPGSNKTNLMLNLCLNIHKNYGVPVLYVSLEMDRTDLTHRIVSNQTGIPFEKIVNPKSLNVIEVEKVEGASFWSDSKFAILDVDEQISVSLLRREIEKRINIFSPKIVCVDYLSLMSSDVKRSNRHDLELGEITKSLKFLGKRHGFHIITAAQMGRSDIKRIREQGTDAQIDTTAVKDSQELSAACENIFAIMTLKDEPNKLRIHVVKSRYGPSGFTKDLYLDASCCKITSTESVVSLDGISPSDWDIEINQTPEQMSLDLLSGTQTENNIEFASMDIDTL